jgi:hypothetical protein
MSLCVSCGLALTGDADFCPHHQTGYAEDWAVANRIMCDFVHRKWIPPTPPSSLHEDDGWVDEDPCGERVIAAAAD